VSLWDIQGNRLSSLRGHENVVQGVSFGQNRQITTITQNSTVRQWQIRQPSGFSAYETLLFRAKVEYSPDGQNLVTTAEKGIKQWPMKPNLNRVEPIGDRLRVRRISQVQDAAFVSTQGSKYGKIRNLFLNE
jgi:WD40 repeat protein